MTEFIPSTPTTYRKIQFRSLLEARWAVFFDSIIGLKSWTYEPFELIAPNKLRYTPDFRLEFSSGIKSIVEVKPARPSVQYLARIALFVSDLLKIKDQSFIILYGNFFDKDIKANRYKKLSTSQKLFSQQQMSIQELWPKLNIDEAIHLASSYRFDLH